MTNSKLALDYRNRARGRRKSIQVLFDDGFYADVVRESQEAAELFLKSLIRDAGHTVPMLHDVSEKLRSILADLPESIAKNIDLLCAISKELRRDRENSFYGSEDITPSYFFNKEDANRALSMLDEVLATIPRD